MAAQSFSVSILGQGLDPGPVPRGTISIQNRNIKTTKKLSQQSCKIGQVSLFSGIRLGPLDTTLGMAPPLFSHARSDWNKDECGREKGNSILSSQDQRSCSDHRFRSLSYLRDCRNFSRVRLEIQRGLGIAPQNSPPDLKKATQTCAILLL